MRPNLISYLLVNQYPLRLLSLAKFFILLTWQASVTFETVKLRLIFVCAVRQVFSVQIFYVLMRRFILKNFFMIASIHVCLQ